jgi:hypothetical protein
MKTRLFDLTVRETVDYLNEIGDSENARSISELIAESPSIANARISDLDESPRLRRARWRGTEHTFGYLDTLNDDSGRIVYAGTLDPDPRLIGRKVNLLLGGLFTMNYPGWGRHNVMMHFNVNHAVSEGSNDYQSIQFQQKFKSKENESAGDMGNFIFIGVTVPPHGLEFEVKTINVSNDLDEAALKVLEGDVVRKGLDILNATTESLALVTSLGESLLNLILTRNRNKIIQEFTLGLSTREGNDPVAKLRTGTYVAAQVRRDLLDWNDWMYDSGKGIITMKQDPDQRFPYNHILFSVLSEE